MDRLKNPFLFHSDDLLQILALVEPSKTKISILQMIVPRLIDPRNSIDQATAMFRYAEEKAIVEELYKERMQIVNASLFKKVDKTNHLLGRGGGSAGRGGGRANRLTGIMNRPVSLPTTLEESVSIYTPVKSIREEDDPDAQYLGSSHKPFAAPSSSTEQETQQEDNYVDGEERK